MFKQLKIKEPDIFDLPIKMYASAAISLFCIILDPDKIFN